MQALRSALVIGRLLCLVGRHRALFIEGGHVHAGDTWDGPRLADGTPYQRAVTICRRCRRELA